MSEDADLVLPGADPGDGDETLVGLSCRAAQARVRAIQARAIVTIAEIEEAAEIIAAQRIADIGRAHGHFSAQAALAWERLQRIGYRRRRLFKTAALRK